MAEYTKDILIDLSLFGEINRKTYRNIKKKSRTIDRKIHR